MTNAQKLTEAINREMKIRKLKSSSRFYNGNSLMGYDDCLFYGIFGPGDTGKSYWVMNHLLNKKYKNPDGVKLFWTRLTDAQCKKLLAGNAKDLVDPDLYRKYHKDLRTRGDTVYYGKVQEVEQTDGSTKSKFIRERRINEGDATFPLL